MSYRDTKEKTARKGRKIKYILLAALVFLAAGAVRLFRLLSRFHVEILRKAARSCGEKGRGA